VEFVVAEAAEARQPDVSHYKHDQCQSREQIRHNPMPVFSMLYVAERQEVKETEGAPITVSVNF
jgi:hypothetical protein